MPETDLIVWAEKEAARLRSIDWRNDGPALRDGRQARSEVGKALEFLRRHAAGSALERAAVAALSRDYAIQVAGDVARSLEHWVALHRDGIWGEQPYGVRARVDAATDLMEQVQRLLDGPNVHPAAPVMLAGAALEELLRSMIEAGPHPVNGKPSINAYCSALQAAQVLTRQEVKDVTAWAGLRNSAAHGEFDKIDPPRAQLMVDGINLFMQRRAPTAAA